jgi:ankyrin repeat protein
MYCNYNDPQVIDDVLKAIADESLDDLRFYLNDGLDPDLKDKWGLPLLVTAVRDGKAGAAGVLLAMGADANIRTPVTQHTPLHYAARGDAAAIVGLLVKHDAKLESVDAYGLTPLHMAADCGAVAAVKALVAAGADVLARDSDGQTPRDRALKHFHQIHQAGHWLSGEHLREAERLRDVEGLKREKAERDIATLKGHNPKRFRLKF